MAKTRRRPAPADWLRTHPINRGGTRCGVCVRPEAVKAVEEFAALGAQYPQVTNYLRDVLGVPVKTGVVANHVRNHR